MIKVYCDSCGKEIDRDEECISMLVCCPVLTGSKSLTKHMHEGCAVCFLGADNVAKYEREKEAERAEWEAKEKATQAARGTYAGDHDKGCAILKPGCICLRCKHDDMHCCRKKTHIGYNCPVQNCPDFEPEETEAADNV